MNLAASYCADNAMEFFGFGGRRTFYDSSMADGFYKYDRATLNIKADFSGKISDHLSWEVGYHFNQFKVKDYHPQDSDQEISLFGLYKAWGMVPSEEVSKEYSSAVRAGLVYDSRDYEGVKVSPGRETMKCGPGIETFSWIMDTASVRSFDGHFVAQG